MAEVRTTSSTGGEKGVKEERYDLIPKPGVDAIARVFAFGATKYADHNWRRGYEWGKSYAALQRHITAFWDGETNDPESGLPHLAHAGFHILVLLTWLEEQGEGVDNPFDDRWRTALARQQEGAPPSEVAAILFGSERFGDVGPDLPTKRPPRPADAVVVHQNLVPNRAIEDAVIAQRKRAESRARLI